jgi:hypothetical protein
MTDDSYLDKKYFIDKFTYNCPFCNRKNVRYSVHDKFAFDWSEDKECYGFIALCSSCSNHSMHLSYKDLIAYDSYSGGYYSFKDSIQGKDIDSEIFYSVPTSFFVIDSRIPAIIRELITEAEGSLKMNFLTGASACMRKSIYELLVLEKIEGAHYEDRIKALKEKYPAIDAELFDILAHIQNMTSDKVHEQSWDKWDANYLKFIIETLKTILYEIYVLPDTRSQRSAQIRKMREEITKKNENAQKEKNV